jgi:hypothetical protein
VLANIALFGFVEDVADIFAGIPEMFELGNEMIDGLLEENIIFPKGVVCIDE